MPRRPDVLLILLAVAVSSPLLVFAQQPDAIPAPSVHVAVVDGLATLEREGDVEPIEPGMPLVDGDRLQTAAGRLELLFEDGATLYVDEFSTLDVLSSRSLRLMTGGVALDVSAGTGVPSSIVLYELDTPAASVAVTAPGEYRILAQDDRRGPAGIAGAAEPPVTTVEVVRGAVRVTSDTGRTDLRTGEQTAVRDGEPPGSPVRFNSARWTPFSQWVELRRGDRHDVSSSRRHLPQDIQAYATEFDRHGTWGVEAQVGPVWYPTVGGGWRPYHNGRWTWIPRHGWTWVGHDAWAWPTHHYGRWGLNTRGSWYWIPGRQWGPAWVSWAIGSTFVSWCPLGFNGQPVVGFSSGSYVYDRVFDPDFAWTTIPGHAFGRPVVAGRIAIAGRRFVDRNREPFVLQHSSPPRPRAGADRFTSRRGGPEFTSRRVGPERGSRGERDRGDRNRTDQPEGSRPGSPPPTRYAVPRTMIGMPPSSLPPQGDRSGGVSRRVVSPQGISTPAPQVNSRSPFLPMAAPQALPQTRYGIPPAVPPLMPPATYSVPASSRPALRAPSAGQGAPARTAVPRSQAAPPPAQSPRAAGVAVPATGGTVSGTSRARSR